MTSYSNIYKPGEDSQHMANELISIRMSRELLSDAGDIARKEGFSNVQDFIRDAVRTSVKNRKLEASIAELKKIYGSAKTYKHRTKSEIDAYIRKVLG